jgi:hypothetical protein
MGFSSIEKPTILWTISGNYLKFIKTSPRNCTPKAMNSFFGMFYTHMFQLQRSNSFQVVDPLPLTATSNVNKSEVHEYSIAIHSRHTVRADDESFIGQEQYCVEKLLYRSSDTSHPSRPCRVFVMSDRPKSVELLTEWLTQNMSCAVVTAAHDVGNGPVQEHGPWAGAGFLEDLEVAAAARDAIVGDLHMSSTASLRELMEYKRRITGWKSNASLDRLSSCSLQNKRLSGYDYGPGTPTFRHHSYLQPLKPVQILEDYIQSPASRIGTIYASFSSTNPGEKDVYAVLNGPLPGTTTDLDRKNQRILTFLSHCIIAYVRCNQ